MRALAARGSASSTAGCGPSRAATNTLTRRFSTGWLQTPALFWPLAARSPNRRCFRSPSPPASPGRSRSRRPRPTAPKSPTWPRATRSTPAWPGANSALSWRRPWRAAACPCASTPFSTTCLPSTRPGAFSTRKQRRPWFSVRASTCAAPWMWTTTCRRRNACQGRKKCSTTLRRRFSAVGLRWR